MAAFRISSCKGRGSLSARLETRLEHSCFTSVFFQTPPLSRRTSKVSWICPSWEERVETHLMTILIATEWVTQRRYDRVVQTCVKPAVERAQGCESARLSSFRYSSADGEAAQSWSTPRAGRRCAGQGLCLRCVLAVLRLRRLAGTRCRCERRLASRWVGGGGGAAGAGTVTQHAGDSQVSQTAAVNCSALSESLYVAAEWFWSRRVEVGCRSLRPSLARLLPP